MQDTWQKEERWINLRTIEARRLDVLAVHRITSKTRAFKSGVMTAVISSRGMHPKHRIAMQRRRSNAFYNASKMASSGCSIKDPTAATFLKRSTMDRSIVIVD